MKDQINLPTDGGTKEDQDQASGDIKSLKRPGMPKLPRRITGYRCVGMKIGLDLETGQFFDKPCEATSEDGSGLCHPEAIYKEEDND